MPTDAPTWEDTIEAPSWVDTQPFIESDYQEGIPEKTKPKDFRRDELTKQTFQARLEGEQAKALTGLTDIGTEAAKAVVRAASHVDPTGFTQGLMQQYGVEPTHVIPTEVAYRGAEIASEAAGAGLRQLGITHDIVPRQVQRPIREFAAENIAALPEMLPALVTGATVAPRPIGRLFQAQMLRGVPESAYVAATAETPEERLKAGLGAGMGLAFPALIERGMRQPSVPIPDFVGRQLEMQRGAIPPRGEPIAPIDRVTPEQAAVAAERMSAPFEGNPLLFRTDLDTVNAIKALKEKYPADVIESAFIKYENETHGVDPTTERGRKIAAPSFALFAKEAVKGNEKIVKLLEETQQGVRQGILQESPRAEAATTIETKEKPDVTPTAPEPAKSEVAAGEGKAWWKQAQERVEGKESWQVTKQEYSDAAASRVSGQSVKKTRKLAELVHKDYVRKAISEGKPVPAEVLADYPDLKPTLKPTETPVEAAGNASRGAISFETYDEPSGKWEQQNRPIVISKSTIPGDKPWRATVFAGPEDSPVAIGHIQLDKPSDINSKQSIAELSDQLGRYTRKIEIKPDEQITTQPAQPIPQGPGDKLQALTAKVESGEKLTASEKKQYLKLRDEATKKQSEPAKPEVGMGGALLGEKNPKSQIEQLTEAAKGVVPKNLPLGERLKQDIDLAKKGEILKEGASKAIGALKNTWEGIKTRWQGIENVDDLMREKGKLSAELESRGWRVRAFEMEMKKAVPSKRDRAAISKWIDAGGDPEVLKRGALETKPEFKQAYIDALDLRGDLLTTAQNARNYFEARLNEAIDAGVLKEGVEDYIHRIYQSRPDVAEKVFANVQTGLLQRNPNLAKKRVFDFDFEAEKLGYKPVQSFIQRIATYETSLSKAIAAREFIKKATEMKAPDGRPVIDIKGVGIPVENAEGIREGTLIKPKFNPQLNNEPGTPNYRGDYVNKEFPSLSRWKWVSSDAGGKPIFVQGDVAIHPDFVHRINALLEPSRVRYGRYSKITKPMLDVGSAVKQTMLDMSGFHQVQITAHGLEHKVLPWKIVKDIDFQNPNVDGLLKGGITLGGDYHGAYKEGLVGNSITRHVPWLGPVLESYHQWLFQSYIPRIKMTMALQALERNRIRYGKTMTDEQILHKTASQANSAFGELNYIMLERSKTTQDIARLILLAPDFLEARGRFAAEALTKGGESKVPGFGNEQRAALLLGALTMYITARIANKALDDQYHFEPENAFSIVYKGHAYSLRTVQGDILHLLEHPLQFWLNRLNPVYGRTTLEMVTGRDYFGRKRSVPEVLWDSVKNVMPISLRNSRERKLWESMMNSFGVNARRYNATDDAFKLATKWKDKNGIQERGEFIYDAEKDPLRGLKIALSQEDDAGAAKEIKKIFNSKVYDRKRLDNYFKRYASMPFTGSKANDVKFLQSLNEDEKQTVEAAKQHKRNMLKLYDQALQKYYAALQTK